MKKIKKIIKTLLFIILYLIFLMYLIAEAKISDGQFVLVLLISRFIFIFSSRNRRRKFIGWIKKTNENAKINQEKQRKIKERKKANHSVTKEINSPKKSKSKKKPYEKRDTSGPSIPLPSSYIVLDTETTGFSHLYDDIIQIGAIKVSNGEVVDTFNTYCKPYKKINNTEIHGITNEMVKDYKHAKEYMQSLLSFMEDLPVFIYNAPFDTRMINVELENNMQNQVIDILQLAKQYDYREDYKLEHIKPTLNIEISSHDALNDCITTDAYYKYLIKEYSITNLPTYISLNIDDVKISRENHYAYEMLKTYIPNNYIDNDNLNGKSVCFTGNLESMSRCEAGKKVITNKGNYQDKVTMKTNILVVADFGYTTTKLKQAIDYNEAGKADINIINEKEFLELFNE